MSRIKAPGTSAHRKPKAHGVRTEDKVSKIVLGINKKLNIIVYREKDEQSASVYIGKLFICKVFWAKKRYFAKELMELIKKHEISIQ